MSEATMLPFFPLLLSKRGLDAAAIGAVLAAMALASFLSNPAWGYLADRRLGAVRAIVASAGGAALLSLLLLARTGDAGLIAAAVVLAAWRAPLASLLDAIALERLPPGDRGEYGRLRLWMSVGWAFAVLVWGAVLQAGTLELIPVLYAGMSVTVALGARYGMGRDDRHRGLALGEERHPRMGLSLALLAFLASIALANAAFAATWNFLALRIVDLGGAAFLVGLGASLQAAAEVPVMRAIPVLGRRISQRGLYVTGCAIYAVVFVVWGFMSDPVWISIVKLVVGVGFALTYVGSVVIVDDLVADRFRATGQGLAKAVGSGLAPVAGTFAGGALYEFAGARTMFLVAGGAAGAAAALAWAAAARGRRRITLAARTPA
jgi:PPP family 3-phenylpropionic acid transporter